MRAPDRTVPVPSPLRGEGQGEGNMRLRWRFRSPHVHRFSAAPAPVNVPGGLAATPLATPAPGKENRRFAVPSAYSFRLSGRARSYIHVGRALSAPPCASPRPSVNASAIFSRTRHRFEPVDSGTFFSLGVINWITLPSPYSPPPPSAPPPRGASRPAAGRS